MGGGGPGKIGQEKDKAIYDMVIELLNGTQGIRDTTFAQGAEGLKTGDIGALHDQIRHAIENSKMQTSEDVNTAKTLLSQKNLGRTPFGANTVAKIDLEGKQRTGLVPSDMINQILQRLAPSLVGQSVETALSGEGNLADIATRNSIAQRRAGGDTLSALIGGVGQLGAAGINAYGRSTVPPPTTPIGPTYNGMNLAPNG